MGLKIPKAEAFVEPLETGDISVGLEELVLCPDAF